MKSAIWSQSTTQVIGVGASKFLGVRRIFARISPNLPEKVFCTFCLRVFSHKDHESLIWCDLQKMVFICFSANFGRHCLKWNNGGHHFAQIFRDFSRIFDKSNLFEVHLHPCLLHHWHKLMQNRPHSTDSLHARVRILRALPTSDKCPIAPIACDRSKHATINYTTKKVPHEQVITIKDRPSAQPKSVNK